MTLLDGSLGFLLARTARSMKRALEARLSAYDITVSQYIVLTLLSADDGISLSKLGHRLYFDNPTITGIVDRMERDGFIERRRIADDRRVINVFLKPRGRKLLRSIEGIADDVNRQALVEFPKSDQEKFLTILNSIWKKMNGNHSR